MSVENIIESNAEDNTNQIVSTEENDEILSNLSSLIQTNNFDLNGTLRQLNKSGNLARGQMTDINVSQSDIEGIGNIYIPTVSI